MKPDIKGLLKLGRFLKRLPRENFRQSIWFEETKADKKEDCGTQGCVAGWAATLFPHRFKKVANDDPWYPQPDVTQYEIQHRSSETIGTEAFANGFRISIDDADRITDGGAHRNSPKVAARAIFSLVNRLKKAAKR